MFIKSLFFRRKGKSLVVKGVCSFILMVMVNALSGCASTTQLHAPCADFGKHCDKAPINSWNSNY